ncbi:MAG: hypothetical protein FJ387_15070 [Verrucomicrobia bacterium]|nr:hypothetical protein [Verrucomicrobiota bacterium]
MKTSLHRAKPVTRHGPCLVAALLLAVVPLTRAHTLPISYLTVVPGAEFLHLELTLNPFELSFFSELDKNRNARLDPAELEAHETTLTARLTECLQIATAQGRWSPAVAGLALDPDSHHCTLRAHYPVDVRHQAFSIESKLAALTSGSHVTQVTCRGVDGTEAARLDLLSAKVTFGARPAPPTTPAQPEPRTPRRRPIAVGHYALGLFVSIALLVGGSWVYGRLGPGRTSRSSIKSEPSFL